jgi:hypothetical protein
LPRATYCASLSEAYLLTAEFLPENPRAKMYQFLAKESITKMDHPPYSSDLAPCDFWLFLKLKKWPERTKI